MTVINFDDGRIWRKATYSADNGGACVCVCIMRDATGTVGAVGIRDSTQGPVGAAHWVNSKSWATFLDAVKTGGFDL